MKRPQAPAARRPKSWTRLRMRWPATPASWHEGRMDHGGDLSEAMRRHGGSLDAWLDLSTGINPWPLPVPAALSPAAWQRLPSRDDEAALVAAARAAYRIPEGVAIVAGPGTQALIQ